MAGREYSPAWYGGEQKVHTWTNNETAQQGSGKKLLDVSEPTNSHHLRAFVVAIALVVAITSIPPALMKFSIAALALVASATAFAPAPKTYVSKKRIAS